MLAQARLQVGNPDLLHDHIMTRNGHKRKIGLQNIVRLMTLCT
jgi:hypothetical protein